MRTTLRKRQLAVANGACIELGATYTFTLSSEIVPLHIDLRCLIGGLRRFRDCSNRIPHISCPIDGTSVAINSAIFPRRRDDFNHPNDLNGVYKEKSSINPIGGS
jgi:hypothetical protein